MSTAVTTTRPSLISKFADRYSVDATKLMDTLKATAFRQRGDQVVTNEQMMALLVVADQYGLNPFTKEIYAYNDKGAIVPVVSVDGWLRIINEHPQFDGMEFQYAEEFEEPTAGKECYAWIECVIFRKDRTRPTIIREYLDETYQAPRGEKAFAGPWQSHTKRMLRHKSIIQCGRVAFGFAGIHDDDEAKHIAERDMGQAEEIVPVKQPLSRSARAQAPAIERADQDGVIEDPVQRPRETVQQTEKPAQQSTKAAPRQAKPAQREPGSDDGFEGTPLSNSVSRILATKMEQCAISESDIKKKFGWGLDGVTMENYPMVVEFIENPS
jgi:phage recombination protein Bet